MAGTAQDRHEEQARKARADLERLQAQSEKVLGAVPVDPNAARDQDWIEVWGRRIGITLGVVAALYVLWDLLTTYVFTT